jgi:hypothetical protein
VAIPFRFYTKDFDVLKKLGIPHDKPWPFMGNNLMVFRDVSFKVSLAL